MDTTRRAAGLALITYGVATTAGFVVAAAPGGAYADSMVRGYIGSGHFITAFAACYLGAFGAMALLVLGQRLKLESGVWQGIVQSLLVVGAAASLVGWFLDGGVAVSMAEGGHPVQSGVPHTVIYTLTETGNLLAICAPAFCVGLVAIVLARQGSMPTWLRISSYVAGVCGILAPVFFTYFVFVLWTIAFGAWAVVRAGRTVSGSQPRSSLV